MAAAYGFPCLLCSESTAGRIRFSYSGILFKRMAPSRRETNYSGIRILGRSSAANVALQAAPIAGVSPEIRDSSIAPPSTQKYIREDYLVKKVSSKELEDLVKLERSVPVIVDFYATWCGPCVLMAQQLEMLAVEYGSSALFVKVDTDDEYQFARDMQVRGLPTLYVFSPDPSKDSIRVEGLVPPEMIKNIIDNEA